MSRKVIFKDELTVSTVFDMANELMDAIQSGQDVAIDFTGVELIDSAAVQVFVAAMKEADIRGVPLTYTVPDAIKAYASSIGVLL